MNSTGPAYLPACIVNLDWRSTSVAMWELRGAKDLEAIAELEALREERDAT